MERMTLIHRSVNREAKKKNRPSRTHDYPASGNKRERESLESILMSTNQVCPCNGTCPSCLNIHLGDYQISEPGGKFENEANSVANSIEYEIGSPLPNASVKESVNMRNASPEQNSVQPYSEQRLESNQPEPKINDFESKLN